MITEIILVCAGGIFLWFFAYWIKFMWEVKDNGS